MSEVDHPVYIGISDEHRQLMNHTYIFQFIHIHVKWIKQNTRSLPSDVSFKKSENSSLYSVVSPKIRPSLCWHRKSQTRDTSSKIKNQKTKKQKDVYINVNIPIPARNFHQTRGSIPSISNKSREKRGFPFHSTPIYNSKEKILPRYYVFEPT